MSVRCTYPRFFLHYLYGVVWLLLLSDTCLSVFVFFFQAEDGIRYIGVTGVQTCALPILNKGRDGGLPPPLLAGGWSRHPIGYGSPHHDEVKGHRHYLCGSEESRHQQK